MTVWYACWALKKKKCYFPSPLLLKSISRPLTHRRVWKVVITSLFHLNYDARAGIRINQGGTEGGGEEGRRRIARQQRYQPWEEAQEAIKGPRNHPLICGRWKTCSPPQINKQAGSLRRAVENKFYLSFWAEMWWNALKASTSSNFEGGGQQCKAAFNKKYYWELRTWWYADDDVCVCLEEREREETITLKWICMWYLAANKSSACPPWFPSLFFFKIKAFLEIQPSTIVICSCFHWMAVV